jgi:hypothetical protein
MRKRVRAILALVAALGWFSQDVGAQLAVRRDEIGVTHVLIVAPESGRDSDVRAIRADAHALAETMERSFRTRVRVIDERSATAAVSDAFRQEFFSSDPASSLFLVSLVPARGALAGTIPWLEANGKGGDDLGTLTDMVVSRNQTSRVVGALDSCFGTPNTARTVIAAIYYCPDEDAAPLSALLRRVFDEFERRGGSVSAFDLVSILREQAEGAIRTIGSDPSGFRIEPGTTPATGNLEALLVEDADSDLAFATVDRLRAAGDFASIARLLGSADPLVTSLSLTALVNYERYDEVLEFLGRTLREPGTADTELVLTSAASIANQPDVPAAVRDRAHAELRAFMDAMLGGQRPLEPSIVSSWLWAATLAPVPGIERYIEDLYKRGGELRTIAVGALGSLGYSEGLRSMLLQAFGSPNREELIEALWVVAARPEYLSGQPALVQRIVEELRSSDYDLVTGAFAAVDALDSSLSPDQRASALAAARTVVAERPSDFDVVLAAAEYLGYHGNLDDVDRLRPLLAGDEEMRSQIMVSMDQIRDRNLSAIEDLVREDPAFGQDAITTYLSALRDRSQGDDYLEATKDRLAKLPPALNALLVTEIRAELGRQPGGPTVADLVEVLGRRAPSPDALQLLFELSGSGDDFRRYWAFLALGNFASEDVYLALNEALRMPGNQGFWVAIFESMNRIVRNAPAPDCTKLVGLIEIAENFGLEQNARHVDNLVDGALCRFGEDADENDTEAKNMLAKARRVSSSLVPAPLQVARTHVALAYVYAVDDDLRQSQRSLIDGFAALDSSPDLVGSDEGEALLLLLEATKKIYVEAANSKREIPAYLSESIAKIDHLQALQATRQLLK